MKAEQFGYHLLLKEDRETLEKLAQQPDLDHIKQKSKDLGYIPVKEEEHQKLHNLAHNPSIDHIIEKVETLRIHPNQRN